MAMPSVDVNALACAAFWVARLLSLQFHVQVILRIRTIFASVEIEGQVQIFHAGMFMLKPFEFGAVAR